MGFFSKKQECPEIGKTIECATFNFETMQKGENTKLKLENEYIDVINSESIKRINWQYSKKEGDNYYFEGTEGFHQWIIGNFNITHTSEDGNQMYLRLDKMV